MTTQQTVGIVFLALSIFSIFWSTLLQKKIPWRQVMAYYEYLKELKDLKQPAYLAFFRHTTDPGSVCWFGIASGVLITVYAVIQVVLTDKYVKEKKQPQLKALMGTSIAINIIIFILMFYMNSVYAHFSQEGINRIGLFENSIPYFILQFTGIGLLF